MVFLFTCVWVDTSINCFTIFIIVCTNNIKGMAILFVVITNYINKNENIHTSIYAIFNFVNSTWVSYKITFSKEFSNLIAWYSVFRNFIPCPFIIFAYILIIFNLSLF